MIGNKKAVAYFMIKNEADIIEASIRHNLHYFEHIFITDNNSTDKTAWIIERLIEEGLPITLWHDPTLAHEQSRITTEAYHKISTLLDFELFFPLDADEFLIVDKSLNSTSMENKDCYSIQGYNYVVTTPNDDVTCITRKFPEKNTHIKFFICHDKNNYRNISIAQGNHYIFKKNGEVNSALLTSISIAHFPYRGVNHYLKKILIGSQAMIAKDPQYIQGLSIEATHWFDGYSHLKSNKCCITFESYIEKLYGVTSIDELLTLTIEDDILLNKDLKYTDNKNYLIQSLVLNYENLALSYWNTYNSLKNRTISMIIRDRLKSFFIKNHIKLKSSINKKLKQIK